MQNSFESVFQEFGKGSIPRQLAAELGKKPAARAEEQLSAHEKAVQEAFRKAVDEVGASLTRAARGTILELSRPEPGDPEQMRRFQDAWLEREEVVPKSPITLLPGSRILRYPDTSQKVVVPNMEPRLLRQLIAGSRVVPIVLTGPTGTQPKVATFTEFYLGTDEEIYAAVMGRFRE